MLYLARIRVRCCTVKSWPWIALPAILILSSISITGFSQDAGHGFTNQDRWIPGSVPTMVMGFGHYLTPGKSESQAVVDYVFTSPQNPALMTGSYANTHTALLEGAKPTSPTRTTVIHWPSRDYNGAFSQSGDPLQVARRGYHGMYDVNGNFSFRPTTEGVTFVSGHGAPGLIEDLSAKEITRWVLAANPETTTVLLSSCYSYETACVVDNEFRKMGRSIEVAHVGSGVVYGNPHYQMLDPNVKPGVMNSVKTNTMKAVVGATKGMRWIASLVGAVAAVADPVIESGPQYDADGYMVPTGDPLHTFFQPTRYDAEAQEWVLGKMSQLAQGVIAGAAGFFSKPQEFGSGGSPYQCP